MVIQTAKEAYRKANQYKSDELHLYLEAHPIVKDSDGVAYIEVTSTLIRITQDLSYREPRYKTNPSILGVLYLIQDVCEMLLNDDKFEYKIELMELGELPHISLTPIMK